MYRNTLATLIFLLFLVLLIWVGALAILSAFMPEALAIGISIPCAAIIGIALFITLMKRGNRSQAMRDRRMPSLYNPTPIVHVANALNAPAAASLRSTASSIVASMVMTVRLVVTMPAVIRLGARIALEVQFTLPPDTPRPRGTGEVKLSIFSPGFHLLSGHVRQVDFSLIREQSAERFEMEAQEEGRHKTRVSAFVGGTWAGSIAFESRVDANAETGQPVSGGSDIQIRTPEDGEVTLEVNYVDGKRAYSYQLSSATFKEDRILSKPLLRSPVDIIDDFVERLSLHARSQDANPSQAVASLWLSGIGISLWREFIPEELNQKFWEHRGDIKRLTIFLRGLDI